MWWFIKDTTNPKHVFIIADGLPVTRKNGEKCGRVLQIKASHSKEKIKVTFEKGITSVLPINKFMAQKNAESCLFDACSDNKTFEKVFHDNLQEKETISTEKGNSRNEIPTSALDNSILSKLVDDNIFEIGISQLQNPSTERMCRPVNMEFVNLIKSGLRRSCVSTYTPVFPVLCLEVEKGEDFDKNKLQEYTFQTLGGNHLSQALQQLSKEGVTIYDKLYVKIYFGLTDEECIRIASDHNTRTQLQRDTSFFEEAALCRKLFIDQPTDDDANGKITTKWKESCRLLLCREQQSLMSLSTYFQVAKYSDRCWQKVEELEEMCASGRLKGQKGKKAKKPLSQTPFTYLKGLSEEEKYEILTDAVKGTLSLLDMRSEAARKKKTKEIMGKMVEYFDQSSWEDLKEEYPNHTRDDDMAKLCNLTYAKNALPTDFLRHCEGARQSASNNASRLKIKEVQESKEVFDDSMAFVASYGNYQTIKHIDKVITLGDHALCYMCFKEKNSLELVTDTIQYVLGISGEIIYTVFGTYKQLAKADDLFRNASMKTESIVQNCASSIQGGKECVQMIPLEKRRNLLILAHDNGIAEKIEELKDCIALQRENDDELTHTGNESENREVEQLDDVGNNSGLSKENEPETGVVTTSPERTDSSDKLISEGGQSPPESLVIKETETQGEPVLKKMKTSNILNFLTKKKL